jgi:hypothetical protein
LILLGFLSLTGAVASKIKRLVKSSKEVPKFLFTKLSTGSSRNGEKFCVYRDLAAIPRDWMSFLLRCKKFFTEKSLSYAQRERSEGSSRAGWELLGKSLKTNRKKILISGENVHGLN